MKKLYAVILSIFVITGVIVGLLLWNNAQRIAAISNFEECAAAGYPILDSYPARCMTPDKRSFTQELSEEEKKKLIPPYSTPADGFTCGNGICEDITCDAIGCPDAETPSTCPIDCPYDR